MANKEAVFSLRVDTGKSVEEIKAFEKGLNDATKATEKSEEAAKDLTARFDEVYGEMLPLTAALGEAEDRLYQLALAGDTASEEYKGLLERVSHYRRVQMDTDMVVDQASKTFSEKLVGSVETSAAVFQGFESVLALTGVESEALIQTMVQLQAAQGVVNSIQTISQKLKEKDALLTGIQTGVQKVYTFAVAQTTAMTNAFNGALGRTVIGQKLVAGSSLLAAGAMKVLNFVMSLNPVLLIVTGIGLLVGALAYFLSGTDEATAANERLNASIDKQNDAFDRNTENLKKNATNRRRLLVANGADEEELHKDTLKRLKEEETNRQKQVKQTEKQLERRRKVLKMAYEEEDEELIKSIKKQINADRKKYNQLVANRKEYDIAVKEENKRYNDLTEKDEKEEADKQKARQEKYAADRKSILDKIRQQEQEYHDSFLSDQDREIIAVQRKYDQLVKEAKKYKINTTELENSRLNDINEINTKYEDQRLKNEEETEKERLAKIAEREQKNLELLKAYQQLVLDEYAKQLVDFEYTQAEQSKKLSEALANNVITEQQFMDAQLELEKKYAEKEKEINKQKEKDITEAKIAEFEKRTEAMNNYLNASLDSLNSISNLNNLVSEIAIQQAEGDAEKQEKLRKQAFNRDKALQLGVATVQGIQAVQNAFTTGLKSPITAINPAYPYIQAALAGAVSAANIAKIAASKYGGGGSAPPAPPAPSGAPTGAAASTFTANTNAQQTETAGLIGGQGQQGGVTQVVVVESDITNVQNKVSAQQALSTY